MASKSPTTPPPTLQRGKACLRCRKRKMRCDGIKPACQQCVRAKKPDACQYDDGRGKTRTQLLRENIDRLEQRIRELEDPEYTSPSVTLHDPHLHRRSESSSSSLAGSPASTGFSAPHSPFPPSATSSPQSYWIQGVPSPSPTPFTDPYHQLDQQPNIEPAQLLVDIFSPHRHQCLFALHIGRLRDSFTRPLSEQHHPVLTNAVFLWACYISRPGPLSEHEAQYLNRTLESLPDALQYTNRVLDVIQASSLLSLYFLSNGRALEGSYHATTAASLAIQCGLHGGITNRSSLFDTTDAMSCSSIKLCPPKDAIEQGERILTFWQVFVLDRCWSAILAKPVAIPDGGSDGCAMPIFMPWPQDMEEYEAGQIDDFHSFSTAPSFFEGPLSNLGSAFSPLALRVKASMLFHHAHQLASSWNQLPTASIPTTTATPAPRTPTSPPPQSLLYTSIQALEHTILRFISTLLPIHQLDATMPNERHMYIVAHTLAHAALLQLYGALGTAYRRQRHDGVCGGPETGVGVGVGLGVRDGIGMGVSMGMGGTDGEDSVNEKKCLRAARACVLLVRHVGEADFEWVDPVVGPCWTYALDVLIRELGILESSSPWGTTTTTTITNARNINHNAHNIHLNNHPHAHTLTLPTLTPDIRNDIATLLYALTRLAQRFPLMGYVVEKVQKRLVLLAGV